MTEDAPLEAGQQQVVVVVAPRGGLDALAAIMGELPATFSAPVVIGQHASIWRDEAVTELGARSALPVRTIQDRTALEPGTVYVVPAGKHAAIIDGHVALRERDEVAGEPGVLAPLLAGPAPSLDLLLRSAAGAYGEGVIAVLLAGTGADGVDGARDVKQAGGTVIVQNPQTAEYADVPQSLAPNTVDVVADVETIGALLQELVAAPPPEEPAESRAMGTVLDQLRERSGIDFTSYKAPTIMRRLQRRMVATGHHQIADYARYLQRRPDEYDRLVSSFLIKVTGFFRDPELYDHLRQHTIPQLIEEARTRGNELRIWSAGCATGEEAYSLAILVAEALGDELEQFNVRVFATDLDNDAISFARHGVYPAAALTDVPPELVDRHFLRLDGEYEIRKRVRALTVFGQHDLGQRAPFPRIDLALCRNVLIYFTTDLQRRALQLFAFALREGGYVALGKAETISPLAEYFAVVDSQLKLYRRQGARMVNIPAARIRDAAPALPLRSSIPGMRLGPGGLGGPGGAGRMGGTRAPSAPATGPNVRPPRLPARTRAAADRLEGLLMQLPVGVVVVDRRYDVQLINPAARQMLGIHAPALGDDFVHLAQSIPSSLLRAAIDRALRNESGESIPGADDGEGGDGLGEPAMVTAETPAGQERHLQLACYLHRHDDRPDPLVMVLVTDVTTAVMERHTLDVEVARLRQELAQMGDRLRRLGDTNQHLLNANHELTAANASLRSTNEELMVGHEEAQASMEEVETLNEELQATNEEQETLNEELQATVEELNTTNDDLQARSAELQELTAQLENERSQLHAVLASMDEALLVVDPTGRIVLANDAYQRLFGTAATTALPSDPAPAEGTLDHLRSLAARGEPFQTRVAWSPAGTAGGAPRSFEARGRPILGDRPGCVVTIWEVEP